MYRAVGTPAPAYPPGDDAMGIPQGTAHAPYAIPDEGGGVDGKTTSLPQ